MMYLGRLKTWPAADPVCRGPADRFPRMDEHGGRPGDYRRYPFPCAVCPGSPDSAADGPLPAVPEPTVDTQRG